MNQMESAFEGGHESGDLDESGIHHETGAVAKFPMSIMVRAFLTGQRQSSLQLSGW